MASDPVKLIENVGAQQPPRTPFVIGSIIVTFLIFVVVRGDLRRYQQIVMGPTQSDETENEGEKSGGFDLGDIDAEDVETGMKIWGMFSGGSYGNGGQGGEQ